MIKISTKGRYGTRAMLELALNYGRGPMFLKGIADRQGISIGYLEQIIPSLKAAGLVNSIRGARGGYALAREPGSIRLKEIIYALEGPVSIVECINEKDRCEKVDLCVTHDLWNELNNVIDDYLEEITLDQLVEKHRSKQKSRPLMYSI
jgi:Rrf2 family protein